MALEISQGFKSLLDRVNTGNNLSSHLIFSSILKVNTRKTILLQPYCFEMTEVSFYILFGLANSV